MKHERISHYPSRLCEALGCQYPVLQAGMGGVARSHLVAAVINAGAYGFLGMVRESPELIQREVDAVRRTSSRPFGVCLIPAATDRLLLFEQIYLCAQLGVDSLCFFWTIDEAAIGFAKAHGLRVMCQVGTLADAIEAEHAGAFAVIAQGVEAGGHVHGRAPALTLLQEVKSRITIPVAISGGFSSAADVSTALGEGAEAVMVGTAFVATRESFAHDHHKRRIVDAPPGSTLLTDLFCINWPANAAVRVLENSVTRSAERLWGHDPYQLPREVVAKQGNRPVYRFSTDSPLADMSGSMEKLAIYAGTGVGAVQSIVPAGDLVRELSGAGGASPSQGSLHNSMEKPDE